MSDIRFINKNGASVDIATVRKRFFECALDAGVGPERTCTIWNDAVFGEAYAREVIEELCGIEIVDRDTGFGFL
jgi:hypothetical protein